MNFRNYYSKEWGAKGLGFATLGTLEQLCRNALLIFVSDKERAVACSKLYPI